MLNYLVVGVGGSGGAGKACVVNGAGGGAGGMLYGTTVATPGITYTVTVGAGGTGSTTGGASGGNSSLSAPGFTTVTATGGGYGGGSTGGAGTRSASPGGSGGGGNTSSPATIGTGTAGQGNPGAVAVTAPGANNYGAGGGGGAGGSGIKGAPDHGGCGGGGKIWPYTGSYYAGGGGGSNSNQPNSIGLGGVGGGGTGGWLNACAVRTGSPGLGGGGGGANSAINAGNPTGAAIAGASGGGGVVTLIAPTPLSATTSGTVGKSYTGLSGSASFTGQGQYLSIPNSTALNLSGGTYTIEGWIYPMGNYSYYNTIIGKRVWGTGTTAWEVFLTTNTGYISFYNGVALYSSTTTPTAHTWNHFAAVYDGTNINLYLNGSRVYQGAVANTDQTANIYIGSVNNGNGLQQAENFIGYMSNLRVLKGVMQYTGTTYTVPTAPLTAITGTSLLTLQSGSSITDASTNAATITNIGSVTASLLSPFSTPTGTTVYEFTTSGTIVFS
jgi:hypothetical protein